MTSQTPTVSVVIATHNRPHLLGRALQSVADQTTPAHEVIVVNDGGVDVSGVVEVARAGGLPVRLVDHPTNRGRSAAFNTGMAAAEGEFVAILADDDCYLPQHLHTALSGLRELGPGHAVYTHGYAVTEDAAGSVLEQSVTGDVAFDEATFHVTNFICAIAVVVPRDVLQLVGGFDTDLDVLEDWELWLRVGEHVRWVHVPAATVEYRIRTDNSNSTTREFFRFHAALEEVYRKHPLPDGSPLLPYRERMLAGSADRAEAFGFAFSLVVACGQDVEAARSTLASAGALLPADSVEVCLFVPDASTFPRLDHPSWAQQVYAVGDAPLADVWALASRRAAGRCVLLVKAGELLDAKLLRQAASGRPGHARRAGRHGKRVASGR